ncbi:hypothetical protein Leryth_004048 [Lithospermum erythrorhizon]|nr:hypothetical protein Leryth_004048 [Lithospermum erythrorhizon]
MMERLPSELCLKIFCFLDPQNLASAQLVCRKWSTLASDDALWSNLFVQRWGIDCATFYTPPIDSTKSWKDVYVVQDRCDRIGLGLKLITEGDDCYLIHQGEIQKHLGSRRNVVSSKSTGHENEYLEEPCIGVLNQILFFVGDLEVASEHAKRRKF